MTRLIVVFLLVLFSGCMTTDYVGIKHAPTTQVDLFFDQADIDRPYTVMGELRIEGDNHLFMRSEKMQRKFVEKARERGADGVLFSPVTIRVTGETAHTSGTAHVDKKGRGWVSESTTTTADEVKELRGFLIKYDPEA